MLKHNAQRAFFSIERLIFTFHRPFLHCATMIAPCFCATQRHKKHISPLHRSSRRNKIPFSLCFCRIHSHESHFSPWNIFFAQSKTFFHVKTICSEPTALLLHENGIARYNKGLKPLVIQDFYLWCKYRKIAPILFWNEIGNTRCFLSFSRTERHSARCFSPFYKTEW